MFAVPDDTITVPATSADPHPVHVAAHYARNPGLWEPRLHWNPVQRGAELLADEGTHQVWLMTWLPGQHTDLHDHGGATGAFTVVRGTLAEEVCRGGASVEHTLRPGQTRVFGPGYTHRVRGIATAASIHVYRPLRSMRTLGGEPGATPGR